MRILGIDPALTTLGWGVIDVSSPKINYVSSGLIKTGTDLELHKRLSYITGNLRAVIKEYQPQAVAMEITFVNNNASSSLKLAYVRGAIMALIGEHGLDYREYAPNEVKKALVGSGHAQKEQVKYMVQVILSGVCDQISFDQADALAVAYSFHANTNSPFN